jgi:hypothetical protein
MQTIPNKHHWFSTITLKATKEKRRWITQEKTFIKDSNEKNIDLIDIRYSFSFLSTYVATEDDNRLTNTPYLLDILKTPLPLVDIYQNNDDNDCDDYLQPKKSIFLGIANNYEQLFNIIGSAYKHDKIIIWDENDVPIKQVRGYPDSVTLTLSHHNNKLYYSYHR